MANDAGTLKVDFKINCMCGPAFLLLRRSSEVLRATQQLIRNSVGRHKTHGIGNFMCSGVEKKS